MTTLKDPTPRSQVEDAKKARWDAAMNGGLVPLWRIPRAGRNWKLGGHIFSGPEELWEAATLYFEWSENNPIMYETDVRVGGAVQMIKVKKKRPFHIKAFFAFAEITPEMWKRLCALEEYAETIEMIENIIYVQKFDHAMVGIFDAGLTAKDLGLSDKKEISGPEGGAIEVSSTARQILMDRLNRPVE